MHGIVSVSYGVSDGRGICSIFLSLLSRERKGWKARRYKSVESGHPCFTPFFGEKSFPSTPFIRIVSALSL